MKVEFLFEDGSKGNHIEDDDLNNKFCFSIVKNPKGIFNVYPIFMNDYEISAGKALFNKEYSNIELVKIREEYACPRIMDFNEPTIRRQQLGFKCVLPNGKIELVYFYKSNSDIKYVFTEQDDVVDYEQVFLHFNELEENDYFIVEHSDGTKSLVFKDLLNNQSDELLYVSSHAKRIKRNLRNKNKLNITEELDGNRISYVFNLLSLIKSRRVVKKYVEPSSQNFSDKPVSDKPDFYYIPNNYEEFDPNINPEFDPEFLKSIEPVEDSFPFE